MPIKSFSRWFSLFFFISSFIYGCTVNTSNNFQLIETSQMAPQITTQTVSLNNCNGKADVDQTIEKSRTTTVEGAGSLGVDYKVLQSSVEAKYAETSSATTSQKVTAPAGTNMEFVLEWTEQGWAGVIRNQNNQDVGSYVARIPVQVKLLEADDLECKAAKGKINSVNAQYDFIRDGQDGMLINVKLDIENRKHMPISVYSYFYYANGAQIQDLNDEFGTGDGYVTVGTNIKPEYKNSGYSVDLFIPMSELHLPPCGNGIDLYFMVQLTDDVEHVLLDQSDKNYFECTSPATPTPIAFIEQDSCDRLLPSTLNIGVNAYVSLDPPNPNTVREKPGGKALGEVPAGGIVTILDGPKCVNGLRWWQVYYSDKGLTGWTPDGDSKTYWLIPK